MGVIDFIKALRLRLEFSQQRVFILRKIRDLMSQKQLLQHIIYLLHRLICELFQPVEAV